MDFNGVLNLFKEDLKQVEESIRNNYASDIPLISDIGGYLVNGGGKRIRPLLLLMSARLCGMKADDRIIKHCCVVEYIHSATLLHDDVLDETTVRRGSETVNSKWGSDASILMGDYLISKAILLLANDSDFDIMKSFAAGAQELVEGGILEFTNARKLDISESLLLEIIERKTSSIMDLSCLLGASLAKEEPESAKALASFGRNFGIAFQLLDDILDYDSSEEILGKPVGNDFKEGHVTLPLFHLYSNAKEPLKREIEAFVQCDHLGSKEFDYIVDKMRESKAIDYSLDKARYYMDQAKLQIDTFTAKNPEYKDCFHAVCEYIVERHALAKACA